MSENKVQIEITLKIPQIASSILFIVSFTATSFGLCSIYNFSSNANMSKLSTKKLCFLLCNLLEYFRTLHLYPILILISFATTQKHSKIGKYLHSKYRFQDFGVPESLFFIAMQTAVKR